MAAAGEHGEGSYSLGEEIELLEAIYIHELTVEGSRESPSAVSVLLHPSTGDEEHKRFVCLTLLIHLPLKYPLELPSIHIKTPRGLSEAHINSILSNLRELAESCLGRPMLYELIEYAKESLTDNNMPSCACAICLCHFQDTYEFTKTECYHYFHCGCLARYIEFSLEQEDRTEENSKVECPMCRLPITYNLTELQTVASSEVKEEEVVYKPSEEVRKLQKKMACLLEKQKKKGGIIDIEQEKKRYLIDITSVRQEEILPESEPPSGTDTDSVKKNPVTEPSINSAPKRPDVAKGNNEPNKPVRSDKAESKEQKEFPKKSKSSRGPRRPFDGSVNRSGEEKIKQHEQRRTEKKRPAVDDRPKSTEQKDREKVAVRKSKEEGINGAPCVDTVKTNPVTEPSTNNGPKRPDVAKESNEPSEAIRNDKPERREQKEIPKNSRSSRGPWRTFDGSGKRSGEEKVKHHQQRRTEKKRPVVDDRPRGTEQKDGEKVGVQKSKEEGTDCPHVNVKQEQTELEQDKKASSIDFSEKATKDVSGRSNNSSSTQTSNGERPKSAKRGRGRSGRGATSGGSKRKLQDGGKDLNKNTTSLGEGVKQTAKNRPLESVKLCVDNNACTQGQTTDLKENPSDKGTNTINKGKARQPPPGFENVMVDKGGCEKSNNDSRPPPPGFEKCSSRPRPHPGLDIPVEGAGQSTSQSIKS